MLPAFVPEMTYGGLTVAEGVDAGPLWESLIRGNGDQAERERLRKVLLDYCQTRHAGACQAAREAVRRHLGSTESRCWGRRASYAVNMTSICSPEHLPHRIQEGQNRQGVFTLAPGNVHFDLSTRLV